MIEALIHRLKIRQTELSMALAQGVPQSYEAYTRMVGECAGVQYTLDTIDDMLEEEKKFD